MNMDREWIEDVEWENPVTAESLQPYFGEIVFPVDQSSPGSKEELERLERFYCADREQAKTELGLLDSFLRTGDSFLLVLEGDVGIGKTWFLRYNLQVRPRQIANVFYGVVDMLRSPPSKAESAIHEQLLPILLDYYQSHCGGAQWGLRKALTHQYLRSVGKDSSATPTESEEAEIELILDTHMKDQKNRKEFARHLLWALEYVRGPRLVIALDNMDMLGTDDQQEMLALVTRLLRNARIRLIVSLRTTSVHLRNRFSDLRQALPQTMKLSPLDVMKMLRPRYMNTGDGVPLERNPVIRDGNRAYRYPDMFEMLNEGEVREIVSRVGHANARIAVEAAGRVTRSNLLHGLHNLKNAQYIISALMLKDKVKPDQASLLVNLFDNDERGVHGSGLIRFRILEQIADAKKADYAEHEYADHLAALGFGDLARVFRALRHLVDAQAVVSEMGYDGAALGKLDPGEVGAFRVTPLGELYFALLLRKQWYYIAAKREMVANVPDHWRAVDAAMGYQFMGHEHLIGFLREQEEAERRQIEKWQEKSGKQFRRKLRSPHLLAEAAIKGKS